MYKKLKIKIMLFFFREEIETALNNVAERQDILASKRAKNNFQDGVLAALNHIAND